jgi:glycosyltransferase involved in cell wall biosynthesis
MRILALEPYYGGSHRAFLDGWVERSRHEWTLFTHTAAKWKWRMRHSPVTFAEQIAASDAEWDILFCSDMLNLAEFTGLAPDAVRSLPKIVYFHENQLTYPVRDESERDYHFVFTNITTALAADHVWFNSETHMNELLDELPKFLKRMPDNQPMDAVEKIRARSSVHYPPITRMPERKDRASGPLHIVWSARWEYEKNPETFFEALDILMARDVDFRVSVIGGGNAREILEVFDTAKKKLGDRIVRWGHIDDRSEYEKALLEADTAVSTSNFETFGIGMVEAAAAGAFPLVPKRLSYPEVFAGEDDFFYDGSAKGLAARLETMAGRDDIWQGDPGRGRKTVEKFHWDQLLPEMDEGLTGLQLHV